MHGAVAKNLSADQGLWHLCTALRGRRGWSLTRLWRRGWRPWIRISTTLRISIPCDPCLWRDLWICGSVTCVACAHALSLKSSSHCSQDPPNVKRISQNCDSVEVSEDAHFHSIFFCSSCSGVNGTPGLDSNGAGHTDTRLWWILMTAGWICEHCVATACHLRYDPARAK